MKKVIILLFCGSLLILGCKSSKPYEKREETLSEELDAKNRATIPLAQRINKLPGIILRAGVPVFQRVAKDRSIPPSQKQPLYVVNGYQVGRSYRQVVSSFPNVEIKEINTLIGVEATSKYGPRGSRGVIEITTF